MIRMLFNWLLSAMVIFISAYVLKGVQIDSFYTAIFVALVLGFFNLFLRPFIVLLTLPINILTLGLFTLVINASLILLTTAVVPGFTVDNFWWAVLFGILTWLLNISAQSFRK